MSRIDRMLTIGLGLNSTLFGKGLANASRQLASFDTNAAKTGSRLRNSLGKAITRGLPEQVASMRKALTREASALSRDLRKIERELENRNINISGIRSQKLSLDDSIRHRMNAALKEYRAEKSIRSQRVRSAKEELRVAKEQKITRQS